MNVVMIHLVALSAKVALLWGVAWVQLYFLRRAPASSRSRLCSLALIAIPVLAAGAVLAPGWIVNAPVFNFAAGSSQTGSTAAAKTSLGSWLLAIWMAGAALMLIRAVAGRV